MELVHEILNKFKVPDHSYSVQPFHQGLINDTYFVRRGKEILYVLQKVNEEVFQNIEALVYNVTVLLPYLAAEDYHKMSFVLSREEEIFYRSDQEGTWRLMHFVKDSLVHNICDDPHTAFEAGRVLGKFHLLVPAADQLGLKETLKKFHDLDGRVEQYRKAISVADERRALDANYLIEFAEKALAKLKRVSLSGLPLRVCHNDTKLNNVLFSNQGKGLCLIDLDTLMPGYFFYDFGDLARTVVNPVLENERDPGKIAFSLPMFESLVKGMFSVGSFLTQEEIRVLPWAVAYMPFLHGIRALTDYLMGDLYYKVSYPKENLDRARSLLHFAGLALDHQPDMHQILASFQD